MGRHAITEPLSETEFAAHDRTRYAGLDRCTRDRRSRLARELRRPQGDPQFHQGTGFLDRRIQGDAADAPRLESAASPADPAGRWPHGRLGVAAGRLPAPGLRTRYARRRSPGDEMQAALNITRLRMWRCCLPIAIATALAVPAPAAAYI